MQKLTLKGKDRSYDIICGKGILQDFNKFFDIKSDKICIITDSNIAPLYLNKLKALHFKGRVYEYVFTAGEASKTLNTCTEIYNYLASNGFSRTDALIALGGGVTGDLTGFIASTYLRGIKFYSVPTSLLSQVDSSVGGKCGVDISYGKNLVGSIYQPYGVLVDTDLLQTLTEKDFADGMAEVIKYGFIYDNEICGLCDDLDKNLFEIIVRCIDIKRKIVEADEFDDGIRMILNFGHTIGHAVEALGNYTEYSHGQAVAIGMAYAAKLSEELKVCGKGVADKVKQTVKKHCLPFSSGYSVDEILPLLYGDKKMRDNKLNFILLKSIGEAIIYPIDKIDVENLLRKII